MAKRVFLLLVVIFFSAVFCVQLSRITHLLNFLNSNVGAEPGSNMRLHPAYYGTEILYTLSKHAGYIQKNVLLASDYTYKLATFVSTLQSSVESDGDFGGFQTFPNEKKDFEVYDGEFVSSVVNSYFAGRVLEISDSPLGGGQENYFKKVDAVAALKFLARSRKDGLYVLYPGAEEVSVASLYYGVKAWQLFSTYAEIPAGVAAIQPESVIKFLKELFHEGGFKHSVQSVRADLQSTYQAVSLLKLLNLWDSFTSNRHDAKESIQKFVLSFRDATTRAFGVPQPDVAHTFWAVSIANQLSLEHVVDTAAVAKFVISLQSPEDGGFKLHVAASSGHFINTFYALETLEVLGKVSLLEDTLVQPERLILAPQFIHNAAFVAVVVLILVAFSGALYLLPHSEEEDEIAEEVKAKGKDKSKKKKKEPTMTIIRDKETKECVDKDGVPYPIDNLNKKEWDIIETKETEKHTIYTLRKKDVSLKQKVKDSPLKARRTHKK